MIGTDEKEVPFYSLNGLTTVVLFGNLRPWSSVRDFSPKQESVYERYDREDVTVPNTLSRTRIRGDRIPHRRTVSVEKDFYLTFRTYTYLNHFRDEVET